MKKLFALLLTMCMLATFCACGSNKETTNAPEQQTQAPVEAQADVSAETPVTGDDSLVGKLQSILGTAISLDNDYELSYEDEEFVNFVQPEKNYAELDHTAQLGDGTTIQLPMTYGDLVNAGWISQTQWVDTAETYTMGSSYFTGSDGKTIEAFICNKTSEAIPLEETTVYQVNLGGEGTETFQVYGLSKGSTVADIVAALGNPGNITYYYTEYEDGDVFTQLDMEYNAKDGTLSIRLDADTGLIYSVSLGIIVD